ncbi:MAG: TRAP transporter large permease subunit [Octadecabacter sp.]
MDPVLIFTIIVVFFGLLALCTPIFAALGVSSIVGFLLHGGLSSLETIPDILHRGLVSYSLLAVPLFTMMGEVMARTSIGSRLFNMFARWLARPPGGLGVASVASSAVFGAMSGVILILTCEMAVITPPVGLNLYVIDGIAPDLSIGQIIRGALPFVGIELLCTLILIAFPEIALFLPSLR